MNEIYKPGDIVLGIFGIGKITSNRMSGKYLNAGYFYFFVAESILNQDNEKDEHQTMYYEQDIIRKISKEELLAYLI